MRIDYKELQEIKNNTKCPICNLKMTVNSQPLMVCTREVKDAIYWDINVFQFTCENKHTIYFDFNQ